MEMEEDGSARNPAAFLKEVRSDSKWMSGVKKDAPEAYKKIVKGDTEALQAFLRETKQKAEDTGLRADVGPMASRSCGRGPYLQGRLYNSPSSTT